MDHPEGNSPPPDSEEITLLLHRVRGGDCEASDSLMRIVYDQLYQLASGLQCGKGRTPTLGPTAVLHEAYAKLMRGGAVGTAEDRRHFFALACRAMRQVIVDYARSKKTQKRSNGRQQLPLEVVLDYFDQRNWDVIRVNHAIDELASEHLRKSQVVELRFFGGMSNQEIAEALNVSVATVEKDWRFARAYIRRSMEAD